MLFLSLSIWAILLYSLIVVVIGNPGYRLVRQIPGAILHQASAYLNNETMPENDTIYLFLRKFFRITLAGFVLFILEMCVTLYFVFTQPKLILPWLILYKNVLMLGLSFSLNRNKEADVFNSVLSIPRWALRLERLSSLISAIAFLILFLLVNQLVAL